MKQDQYISQQYVLSDMHLHWNKRPDIISLTLTKVKLFQTDIYTLNGGIFPGDVICSHLTNKLIINTHLHPGYTVKNVSQYVKCRIEKIYLFM